MLATHTIDPEDLFTISAGGFSATADAFARDDQTEGLWFVSMVGSQTALKAIWASLLKQPPDVAHIIRGADGMALHGGYERWFVAEGLCRLFQGRQATIVLVDHDRVEPHNLLRQNFYPEDVGRFKSQALADRLAKAFRRPVGYSVYAFREEDSRSDGGLYPGLPHYGNSLIIGCADNAAARRAMAESLPGDPRRWLIDAGNDTNWGQVLIGNVADRDFGDEQAFVDQTCYLLPAPTVQRPDLLTAVSTTPPDVDCAAALDLTDQDPTINQMMASLALQVVRRMAAGTCPFMGLYLDMEQGTVTPTYATPETVARVVRSGSEPGIVS